MYDLKDKRNALSMSKISAQAFQKMLHCHFENNNISGSTEIYKPCCKPDFGSKQTLHRLMFGNIYIRTLNI